MVAVIETARPARKTLTWNDEFTINFLAGGISGALTATFLCPLDVLKTRLQVQDRPLLRGQSITGSLVNIFKQEGCQGLYRGLSPALIALLPNWAVYFTVYDKLKHKLTRHSKDLKWLKPPVVHMSAAAGAGLVSFNKTALIRNRKLYRGTADAFLRICREEGVAGLYSGLLPSIFGVAHVAIQFPLYEAIKNFASRETDSSGLKIQPLPLIFASAVSKVVASTITYPHEVVRSHMHLQGSVSYMELKNICTKIFMEHGPMGFYRGCTTNLCRTTPAAVLTFTSYEFFSHKLSNYFMSRKLA